VLAVLIASLVELLALRGMHNRIEGENIAHQVTRARRALELRQQQKAAIITEFANWDEAYDYASNPHRPGSDAFIQDNYIGWLPVRYGDRVIKIWNRKRETLLSWSDSGFAGLDRRLPADEIIATTVRLRTAGGFLRTSRGLFLAGAAVILRSSDEQMLGEANGVVFAAQPVDSAMESERQHTQ
jgi:sensor domain CHASE-containing protein